MNKTSNYQLNQWELHDRVMMQDFNADNAKIDAALKAEADARAAADAAIKAEFAKFGNCRIVYTSYVGDGTYERGHETTLTFDGRPLLIFVCGSSFAMGYLLRGCNLTMPIHREGGGWFTTWGENSVSWYSPNADSQFNVKGNTYYVVAFLADD